MRPDLVERGGAGRRDGVDLEHGHQDVFGEIGDGGGDVVDDGTEDPGEAALVAFAGGWWCGGNAGAGIGAGGGDRGGVEVAVGIADVALWLSGVGQLVGREGDGELSGLGSAETLVRDGVRRGEGGGAGLLEVNGVGEVAALGPDLGLGAGGPLVSFASGGGGAWERQN